MDNDKNEKIIKFVDILLEKVPPKYPAGKGNQAVSIPYSTFNLDSLDQGSVQGICRLLKEQAFFGHQCIINSFMDNHITYPRPTELVLEHEKKYLIVGTNCFNQNRNKLQEYRNKLYDSLPKKDATTIEKDERTRRAFKYWSLNEGTGLITFLEETFPKERKKSAVRGNEKKLCKYLSQENNISCSRSVENILKESGFRTNSKNHKNIIYQTVNRLRKTKIPFKKARGLGLNVNELLKVDGNDLTLMPKEFLEKLEHKLEKKAYKRKKSKE